jgi:hypothetical protein
MSWVRLLGIIIAVGLMIYAVSGRGRGTLNRGDVFMLLVVALGLLVVAAFPSLLNGLLLFKRQSRIVTLLVLSQFGILIFMIKMLIRVHRLEENMSRLVHNMAIREFSRQFGASKDYRKKILVIIPAYNEAENLRFVLGRLPKEIFDYQVEVIVAVDGATDATEEVVREFDFPAVVNQINRGGGAALKAGYDLAIRHGAEIVVTMDADGQHLPEEIPSIVEPIVRERADFVNGSRILGSQEKGEMIRQVGMAFFNKLVSVLLMRRVTDSSNAFRAIRVSELSRLELREDQFHTTELLIEAVSKGLGFKEVPITIRHRWSGESKKPTSFAYGMGFFRAIMRTWLRT